MIPWPAEIGMADEAALLTYRFTLKDGSVREFPVRLDPTTLDALPKERPSWPEWTRLSANRCPVCPLKESAHPNCLAAMNVIEVVEAFKDCLSTEEAFVEVFTKTRAFSKRASLAEGVSALMGVLMPTSGCPVLAKLKPNVLTHLPFATVQETIFRTLAMYLLAQFFIDRRGGRADWKLEELGKLIEDVRIVNKNFCERFYQACLKDVNVNALVHLDCFAGLSASAAQKGVDRLSPIEKLFDAYAG
ncbi:MAG: hypothetical protein HY922_05710 [Elusimicrobia bacterium]|nr:hypothetical protein [Elusimicrobiota bacterium]